MAIKTNKSIFYHIPKTGGIWVKEAMRQSGIAPYGRCKDRKGSHPWGLKREHSTPDIVCDEDKNGLFSFCFVRHPITWYKSHWCYRVKIQALDINSVINRVWHHVFETFVLDALEAFPSGYITELYQYYVGKDGSKIDFIGRQENLTNDLVEALTLAGEDFSEEDLRHTRWRNVSAGNRKLGDLCILSAETENRILEVERWVIDNFYKE